jgi:hypothetical protein
MDRSALSVLIRRTTDNFRVARHPLRTATIPVSGFRRRLAEPLHRPARVVWYWSNEEGIHHFDVRKIGVYCAYFSISEETNCREMLVEDLVSILGSIVQRQR